MTADQPSSTADVTAYRGDGSLERVLRSGAFAVTAEVTPPLSSSPGDLLDKALPLRGLADAVNVTDGASARVHMSSLAAAALLATNGIEPVLQMTCRDRNRLALQGDVLGAGALGIPNILMLRGDDVAAGDQPDAASVFDYESRDLIAVVATMRGDARLPSGREIAAPPKIFIGAAELPSDPAADWDSSRLRAKSEAGADFVQTQFCFDAGVVRRYAQRLGDEGLTERLFILIGIGPPASARSARWMRDNLFGTLMPDAVIERLEGAADARAEGVDICVELLQELADIPGIAGAHIMAPLNEASVPEVIERSGVVKGRGGPQ
jgi:methylenetetrahydrofolate reductase (NADPH)